MTQNSIPLKTFHLLIWGNFHLIFSDDLVIQEELHLGKAKPQIKRSYGHGTSVRADKEGSSGTGEPEIRSVTWGYTSSSLAGVVDEGATFQGPGMEDRECKQK